MKTDIRNRYDIVVKAARTSLDKALASVDDVIADTERELASSLEEEQRNADTICQLQGHIQVTADKGYGCELTGVIKDMQKSGGIGDFIHSVTSQSRTTMACPVLQYLPRTLELKCSPPVSQTTATSHCAMPGGILATMLTAKHLAWMDGMCPPA